MASLPSSVTVLDRFQVSPPPGSAPNASLPLTFFDVVWLPTGPVERIFFYPFPHPTSHFVSHHLPSLKSSLSRALRHFYPLAGRVVPPCGPSPEAKFQIRCSDGDSVSLTLAESSDDFRQLSGDQPRGFGRVYGLIPQLPPTGDGSIPLLALQITVFPDQGVSIGVAVHHVACDDSSSIHFVKSWAAAAACSVEDPSESPLSPPPLCDPTVIADPDGLYYKILTEMQNLKSAGPPPAPLDLPPVGAEQGDAVIASFLIGREQIDRLKQGAMARAGATHVSTFVVACAFAWACLVRAQAGFYAGKKSAHLLFSVECRGRLEPPVPAGYFGNCLRPCFVEVSMSDLIKDDGVFAAAEAIGRAIKGLEHGILKGAEGWLEKIVSLTAERPMSIAGSPRYRVYDADLGWGRPIKVEMTSIEKTPGTVSLAESRDGGGGIEMGLVLPEKDIDEFARAFLVASSFLET
ncbi:anthocyanidin 3-O-glucoside 6''-O-acyltransferase-like [Musa acuminata AAA Group]|uniref:anthocyanidin 3-O-glucoside 6''-O-acyltransferase-like n=1 Tax=Musa acuminata AAA Group TaxID=214697 RepID=UPI0031D04B3C